MDYKTEQIKNKLSEIESRINDSDNASLKSEFYDLKNLISSKLDNVKYGLVFEESKENIEINCETKIPYLEREREINASANNGKNFLIEGDNYASLKLLEKTHKGKIDIIYIDPPYNTGNKDFIYNDKLVDCEDGYRHSKWLNFMYKRLTLSRLLLRDNGIILISIDNNELCNLKLLCDEVFGEQNLISIMPRKTVEHIRTTSTYELQNLNDYVLFYAKNKLKTILNKNIVGSKEYNFEDEIGFYMLKPFQNSGENGTREARPNLYYPIYFNRRTKKLSLTKNYEDDIEILPRKVRNKDGRWLWSREKFLKDNELLEYKDNKLYRKEYYNPESDQNRYAAYKNWLDMFPNRLGANALKKLNLLEKFDYSKPVELMKMLINLHPNKNVTVLDFFAGSGTTGQAVLELNEEDGGNRKFILCTNNENNICEDVTYERLKTVITGKRKDGSTYRENPYGNNLTYLKINFAEKEDDIDFYKICEQLIALKSSVENRPSFVFDNDDEFYDFLKSSICLDDCVVYLINDVLLPSGSKLKERKIEIRELPKYFYSEEELINNDII